MLLCLFNEQCLFCIFSCTNKNIKLFYKKSFHYRNAYTHQSYIIKKIIHKMSECQFNLVNSLKWQVNYYNDTKLYPSLLYKCFIYLIITSSVTLATMHI